MTVHIESSVCEVCFAQLIAPKHCRVVLMHFDKNVSGCNVYSVSGKH